ncbi:MAG: hypothetical protein EHM12_01425 [Dehalococcoidia bacterium]|nr:MAG: hypothetical protein EHM12_01425 [Dehalococcoidia bacterium]
MEDTSKMLSQEEIDAMVGKTASKPAPAHKVIPATPVKTASVAPAPVNVNKVNAASISVKSAPEP